MPRCWLGPGIAPLMSPCVLGGEELDFSESRTRFFLREEVDFSPYMRCWGHVHTHVRKHEVRDDAPSSMCSWRWCVMWTVFDSAWRITCDGLWCVQIFAFIGIVESVSYEKCFYGQVGDGNLGFDPLGLGKNPASLTYYKVKTATHTVNSNSDTSPDSSARMHSHAVSVCLGFGVRVFVCVRFFLLIIPPNAKGSGTKDPELAARPFPSLLKLSNFFSFRSTGSIRLLFNLSKFFKSFVSQSRVELF